MESHSSSAFYVPDLKFGKTFRVSDNTDILNAELFAILQVLTWIEDNPPKMLAIFSDSLNALYIIDNLDCTNIIALEIRKYLRYFDKYNIKISIIWVPCYVGHKGNETADFLAKQGLKNSEIDKKIPLQLTDYVQLLEKFILDIWQNRYSQSKMGLFYTNIVPNVSLKIKYNEPSNR